MDEIVYGYEYKNEIRELFTEYTDMLVEHDAAFKVYLNIQNYDDEIEHLEHKYGLPEGRLYLLRRDGRSAGCIALRKLDTERCEMKRLYVRPEYRGEKLGEVLVRKIIGDAREIGYKHMMLDTLPFLESAIRMYKKLGFYETDCYNDSPMDTTIFMRLDL